VRRRTGRRAAALAAAGAATLAVACGGGGGGAAGGAATGLLAADAFRQHDEVSGLTTILATTDLAVGRNRFAFVLTDRKGLVRLPVVTVDAYYYPSGYEAGREGPVGSSLARFEEFPLATRGVFVTEHEFDRAGAWGAQISFPLPDGSVTSTEMRFAVASETLAPAIGERPPASVHRTLADVASPAELTTGSTQDPGLYSLTIAEALDNGRPLAVVFASPAFCTTPVCGPQVEVVSDLRARFGSEADFIHIDLFANPQEIQGDLGQAVRHPVLSEWGIRTDEWTFVIGSDGKVSGRFEGFAPRHELEGAIAAALGEGAGAR
jgi:hypothetical protein